MAGKSEPIRLIFRQDWLFPGASGGGLIRVVGVQSEIEVTSENRTALSGVFTCNLGKASSQILGCPWGEDCGKPKGFAKFQGFSA